MVAKQKIRDTFLVLLTSQIIAISYTAMKSPFIANNYLYIILINCLFCFAASFYLLDFKYIRGWYFKKKTEMIQRIKFKEEIKRKAAIEVGLGYDKIKR